MKGSYDAVSYDAVLCSVRVIAAVSGKVDRVQRDLRVEEVIKRLVSIVDVATVEDASLVAGQPRERLVIAALKALKALADVSDKVQEMIVRANGSSGSEAGGIAVLVELLRRIWRQDTDKLYAKATKTINCIATTSTLKAALTSDDTVALFLDVMKNGSPTKKESTVKLVAELVPKDSRWLADITRALSDLLHVHRFKEPKLVVAVLKALWSIMIGATSVIQLRIETSELLVDMLGESTEGSIDQSIAKVLSRLAKDSETAKVLLRAGIIRKYVQVVGNEIVRGALLLGVMKLAAHEESLQHEDWKLIIEDLVKLADPGAQEPPTRVQERAAEALSLLSPVRKIAEKIGTETNLKKLVLLATGTWSNQSKFAMKTLLEICKIPEKVPSLVETGLCEAAVHRLGDWKAANYLPPGLKLLEKLSATALGAKRLSKENVAKTLVAQCVATLGKSKLRLIGLAILVNIYDHATAKSNEQDGNESDADSDNGNNGDNSDESDESADSGSESDSAKEDDTDAKVLLGCFSKSDRVKSLARIFPELGADDRPGFIRLLAGLASMNSSYRGAIRGRITADKFVGLIRDGTPAERVGAACVLSSLVSSKAYCQEAEKAEAVDAYVELIAANEDSKRVRDSTTSFLSQLQRHELVDASQKLLETLLSKAGGDSDSEAEAVRGVLEHMASVSPGRESLVSACATVLAMRRKERDENAVDAALKLVEKLCESNHYREIRSDMDRLVKALVSLFKEHTQWRQRFAVTLAIYDVVKADTDGRRSGDIGKKCIKTLIEISRGDDTGEKEAAFMTLVALCEKDEFNLGRLSDDDIHELCEQYLQDNKQNVCALALVTMLAENKREIVLRKKILARIVDVLDGDDFEYPVKLAMSIEALAQYPKARKFFKTHNVKQTLKQLKKKEGMGKVDRRAIARALETLDN